MSNEPKAFNGTLTNFGVAPYQHDSNNSQSYFVDIKQPNGNDRTIWAMGLREHIEKGGFKVGDQVNLIDLGVPEGSRRKEWQVERYEPSFDKNSIEADFTPEKQKQAIQNPINDYDKLKSNFDLDALPSFVKNNYIGMPVNRFLKDEKVNYYDKADQSSVAFEDRKNALHTSRQDEKTIKAMLDLAQSKGWSSIKLKGTEEFKREAWLEASIRGIETKGYTPTEKDLADLKIRQELRTNNQVEVDKQSSPTITATQEQKVSTETPDLEESSKPQEKQGFLDKLKDKFYTKETDKTKADHLKDVSLSVATSAGLALATGDSLTTGMLAKDIITDKADNLAMDKVVDLIDNHQQNVDNSLAIKKEWHEINYDNGEEELSKHFDNIGKYDLNENQLFAIEVWRRKVENDYKDHPDFVAKKLNNLNEKIPDIASGKFELPMSPDIKVTPNIEVQTHDKASQDRVR